MAESACSLSRRRFLAASTCSLALPALAVQAAGTVGAAEPLDELVALEVRLAQWIRQQRDKILQAPPDGKGAAIPWANYGFKWPAYTLAHLWSWKHPANPLEGADWCAALALELYDKEVSGWNTRRSRGQRGISTYENPHYVCAYLLETLGTRINDRRRQRWLEHEQAWVKQALVRPLGRTGRYHDSWRFTALYQLGKVLNRPKWTERGVELFHEMLKLQTPEGFWLEQRGPSFRYHGLMLPSLAWMYRWTGERAFRSSAERLTEFLTTYVYPDAISVGPFDVRNNNVLAYFPTCAGLELTPAGRAFAARGFQLWRDLGMFRNIAHTMVCTRDLGRAAFYVADTVRYLNLYAPKQNQIIDKNGKLPIDRDGVLEHHTQNFDGMLVRKGPWVAALSSQNPSAFRQAKSRYMLTGASRIELWHEKFRLVFGGGHSHREESIPFANVFFDSIGANEFGRLGAGLSREERISSYLPREAITRIVDNMPELVQTFDHGTIRLRFQLQDEHNVEILADWKVQDVKHLCLQIPLVVWRDAKLLLDGNRQVADAGGLREVQKEIQVHGGPFAGSRRLQVPRGVPCRLHWPLTRGQFHGNRWREDPIRNPYDIALVSCQWTAPPQTGKAKFLITVSS